ncbi:hypothetical protein [Kitasatospora camelliae]|uniref:Excreted virulence factor EspC (Type VII ESX diderm) n=1 Tax=Kitasatospora camelliae TaxID=3156397 RepID=A0AAU8JNX6_9ACTN
MSDLQLSVDTDRIATGIPAVRDLASRTRDVSTSLIARLPDIREVCGSGPMGQAIVDQYESTARSLLQGFVDASTVIDRTADGVHGMTKGLADTEQTNIDALRGHGVTRDTGVHPVKAPGAGRR